MHCFPPVVLCRTHRTHHAYFHIIYCISTHGQGQRRETDAAAHSASKQTTNHKTSGQKQTLCVTNRVVCSSRLMMGFFITCLIILMAVMFISTVYCCFGVSDLLKIWFDHATLSPLTTKLIMDELVWLSLSSSIFMLVENKGLKACF